MLCGTEKLARRKEDIMNRLLACTAVALALGLSPALAADQQGQLPTQPGVSSDAAKAAHQPQSGSADTSVAPPSKARLPRTRPLAI
jgi:hypothetical protein